LPSYEELLTAIPSEENGLRLEKWIEEMEVAAMASPLTPLHYALDMSEKQTYDSRHTEGW
jgi:hypothetical protein